MSVESTEVVVIATTQIIVSSEHKHIIIEIVVRITQTKENTYLLQSVVMLQRDVIELVSGPLEVQNGPLFVVLALLVLQLQRVVVRAHRLRVIVYE